MVSHMEKVLWTQDQIAFRVSSLASQISADLSAISPPPSVAVVGVATGAFLFLATSSASSPSPSLSTSSEPKRTASAPSHPAGREVADIVDTGSTVACLIAHLESKGASSVSVCTFLDKPARRRVHFELVGRGKFYAGFECPDYFVVGYGMDFAELYRNLPYVGVLKPELYKECEFTNPWRPCSNSQIWLSLYFFLRTL